MLPLDRLPPFDSEGTLRAVIETPRGCRTKYAYDPELGALTMRHTLPDGLHFPYDFGFIPSTTAGDGDPLDVLVLTDAPLLPLTVVDIRLIGAIEARQREGNGKWTANDRLIAVALKGRAFTDVATLRGLRPQEVAEMKAFFISYNAQRNRVFKPVRDSGPDQAMRLVRRAVAAFKKGGGEDD